ncbi:MAG: hypothetical protein ACKO6L_09805, partial [Flavobacteriales bacterium]
AMAALLIASCDKKKDAVDNKKIDGEKLITEYCDQQSFPCTAEVFRASGTGESINREEAKRKARNNAQAVLASTIRTTIKTVSDNYSNSTEVGKQEQFEAKTQTLTQKIVDEKLVGAITVCEKLTQMENGNYRSYMAIELTGKEVFSALNTGLSQDQILKVDYDYEKFKAEFEKEMNKRAGGQ